MMPSLKLILYITAIFVFRIQSAFGIRTRDKEYILTAHNEIRRHFANQNRASDMRKLKWSYRLQVQAEWDIMGCYVNTDNQYDISVNFDFSRHGNISHIINSWIEEKQTFIPLYATCINLKKCKHLLTMINSKHSLIGCAVSETCQVESANVTSLLCHYHGGDMITPAYRIGPPCTKCDGSAAFCEDGLCVSCDTTTQQCDCRKTCRKTNIGIGRLDNSTCSCNCTYGMGPNCDEECVNPQQYEDWDPCAFVTPRDCMMSGDFSFSDDAAIFREYCPASCGVCNRYPIPSRVNPSVGGSDTLDVSI